MMVNRSSYSKNRRHIAEGGGAFSRGGYSILLVPQIDSKN